VQQGNPCQSLAAPLFDLSLGALFMKMISSHAHSDEEEMFLVPPTQAPPALPAAVGPEASKLLQRMFRDPRVLQPHERGDLITRLRSAVDLAPAIT
jgi:hypothetical protein